MDPALAAAVVASLTSLALGIFAHQTAKQARQADEKTTENAQALDGWKELVGPLREELKEVRAERDALRAELEEMKHR